MSENHPILSKVRNTNVILQYVSVHPFICKLLNADSAYVCWFQFKRNAYKYELLAQYII